MDTVSMLNKMSFYCQPILPLVYDESMSYYETLCKVVGQLNTTGDTVNKLNEGLTDEITGRQEADRRLNERLTSEIDNRHEAERLLNERLKVVEEKTNKIHFLIFAGTPPHSARPVGAMPTRSELRQWINDRDMIVTLLETNDEERNVVYAMSCVYNAVNWTHESPVDFNIIVPISTDYDSERDYAVRQKIAKITIPPDSVSSLDENWGLQVIEVDIPHTSADGVVNLVATVSGSDSVNCSITPSEFLSLYNMTRGGKNLCVAVNARLEYDAHVYSSSIATVNPDGRTILITFEKDNGVYTDYGVNQTIRVLHYLVGNAETNTWEHESIRSRIQDFVRYEGFQFTRKSGNVIATENDTAPSAVYSYYMQLNGKFYQNLPVGLIDEVDNAEYWNGVFDIKDNKHMTFTFVTSNYVTASGKMTVRVIELSADANSTTWKYAEKEFELPFENATQSAAGLMSAADKTKLDGIEVGANKTVVDAELSSASTNPVMNGTITDKLSSKADKTDLNYKLDKAGGTITGNLTVNGDFKPVKGLTTNGGVDAQAVRTPVLTLHDNGAAGASASINVSGVGVVEVTAPDGDKRAKARLKIGTPTEDNDAATKKYVDDHSAGGASDFVVNATLDEDNNCTVDKTYAQIQEAVQAGKNPVVRLGQGGTTITMPLVASGGYFGFAASIMVMPPMSVQYVVSIQSNNEIVFDMAYGFGLGHDNTLPQVDMASDPSQPMEIATKQYVDAHTGGSSVTVDTAMSDTSTNAVQNKVIKKYVDDHSSSASTKVTLTGNIEGAVEGYTSTTYQQITDEIAKNCNIWLTIGGETVRLASYKQSVASAYTLVFFGAGDGALTVKYEVTASASSASLTVTGS